jgi:hypothetical protein
VVAEGALSSDLSSSVGCCARYEAMASDSAAYRASNAVADDGDAGVVPPTGVVDDGPGVASEGPGVFRLYRGRSDSSTTAEMLASSLHGRMGVTNGTAVSVVIGAAATVVVALGEVVVAESNVSVEALRRRRLPAEALGEAGGGGSRSAAAALGPDSVLFDKDMPAVGSTAGEEVERA